MRSLQWFAVIGTLISTAGCATRIAPEGDGSPASDDATDRSTVVDASVPDGFAPGDGSLALDARPSSDVPSVMDAPSFPDAAPPRDAFIGPDAPPPSDVPMARDARPPSDVPLLMDVQPTVDVPVFPDAPPPNDVPVFMDVQPMNDVPVAMDVQPTSDVPTPTDARDVSVPPDAPMNTLVGRWRAVRYDFVNNGMNQTMTDENSPFPIGTGVFIDGRINGELFVTGSRLAESFGVLLNDHFYINDMAANTQAALSAYGVVIAGSVNGGTFSFFGGSFTYTFNPDGTITQVDTMAQTALTWARTDAPPAQSSYSGVGQAAFFHASTATPIAHPRLALAWDKPGVNTGVVYTDDVAISFGAFNTAQYGLNVIAPPAAAIGLLGATQVAIAYLVVYDDTNLTGAYEAGRDSLRGISSVALVWRAGAASTQFSTSPFRDADEGFQLVELATDYTNGRLAAEPWDQTHPAAPDIALNPSIESRPFPDVLR